MGVIIAAQESCIRNYLLHKIDIMLVIVFTGRSTKLKGGGM